MATAYESWVLHMVTSKIIIGFYVIFTLMYMVLCVLRILKKQADSLPGVTIFHPIVEIILKVIEIDMMPSLMMFGIIISVGCSFWFATIMAYLHLVPIAALVVGHFLNINKPDLGKKIILVGKGLNLAICIFPFLHIWMNDLQFKEPKK